jgi:hypothetical protein
MMLLMNVQVEPVNINGEQEYKLRLDGVLFGVFWTKEEALLYAADVPFNWDNDLSFCRPPRK